MPDTNQVQRVLNDPNFYSLPLGERVKVLSQLDANFSALPTEEQNKVVSRGIQQPPAPAAQPGAFQTHKGSPIYNSRTGNMPEDADLPTPTSAKGIVRKLIPPLAIGDALRSGARTLEAGNDAADYDRQRALANGQPDPRSWLAQGAREVGAATLRTAAGTQSPTNVGITAGAVLAPQLTLPALVAYGVAHGGYKIVKGAYGLATKGATPENVGNTLGGAGELLGSAAIAPAARTAGARAWDTLHPTPDVPPGLSPEATANLTDKTARLGAQDVFRSASPSADNPAFRERLSIAAPDLAEIQRRTPLQTSGGVLNPDYRIREFTTNANNYLDDLWNNQRQPQIDRNANAVRSLDPIKQSIADSVSDLDSENYPGAVQEIGRKVQAMPDYETLGQLSDRLREVNAQRTAFRGMTPQEQAAAGITAPKMDAINAEYRALQNVISDELANRGEPGIQAFDKRYRAISEVRDTLQDQMNPAEATRLLDQVRAWISPTGAVGIHERVPLVASPGRTLESGLNRLARSPLAPPATAAPNPPPVAGLLPPPPPILASPPDTSGPVAAGDRTQPMTWSADMRNQVARQAPAPPPPVMPQFRAQTTMAGNPNAIGPIGRGAIQIKTLPTEHPGEGNYAGLLPGPPSPFVPPPPAPPLPQVGMPPTLGFPPTMPDTMWTPRATAVGPTWELFDANQPATTPSGAVNPRLQLAPPLWPPKR